MIRILPALIALSVLGAPACAERLRDGVYENSSGGRVIVDGTDVALTVKAMGCLGDVDGTLGQNRRGDWFILSVKDQGAPRCVMSVKPEGKFNFVLEQLENCSYYHGASCEYSGYYRRSQ